MFHNICIIDAVYTTEILVKLITVTIHFNK